MKHFYISDLTSQSNLVLLIICLFISCNNPVESDKELISKADAGEDQITYVGSYAVVDPSKSTLTNNDIIDLVEWVQDPGNPEKLFLVVQSSLTDKFITSFPKEGKYKLTLTIKCKNGNVYADSTNVIVKPRQVGLIEDVFLEARIRYGLKYKEGELNAEKLLLVDSLPSPDFYLLHYKTKSIKGIDYCTNIKYLFLGNENINDLQPLSNLTKLEFLDLDQNYSIGDISPLHNLINLNELWLGSNPIMDISPLQNLNKLNKLYLTYTPTNDINSLSNLINLEILFISGVGQGTFLNSIEPLRSLTELRQLHLTGVGIDNIEPLENLSKLELLDVSYNNLAELSPVSKMKNLIRLYIRKNKVGVITGIKNLANLDFLDAADNQIKDISELQYLSNLHLIGLSGNKIEDIAPLANNPNLGVGVYLYLGGNPLNEKSLNEYIPALIARGVKVFMM